MDDPRVEDVLNNLKERTHELAADVLDFLENDTLTGQLNPGQIFALRQAWARLITVKHTIEDTRVPSR